MHGQIHLAEVDGLQGFLLSIDGDCGDGVALVASVFAMQPMSLAIMSMLARVDTTP